MSMTSCNIVHLAAAAIPVNKISLGALEQVQQQEYRHAAARSDSKHIARQPPTRLSQTQCFIDNAMSKSPGMVYCSKANERLSQFSYFY